MKAIGEQIAEVCARRPEAIALRRGEAVLSYRELGSRADQLAAHLVQLGLRSGGTAAICLERSFDWTIAALAIMRAGAAYLPVDLTWPDERVQFVLRDSGASVVVAKAGLLERIAEDGVAGVDPCCDHAAIVASPALQQKEIAPEDLAYVIYTSGSTGVPKGVEITHANLAHLIEWHNQAFAVTEQDHASHLAGLGFDAAVWEVWPYLAAGATVSLVDDTVRTSPELLQQWMVREGITIGFVPTALAAPMISGAWPAETKLRYLLTGGDKLHRAPVAGLPFAVVNNYGPTECTVVATSGLVVPGSDAVPTIGRAIAGANVYVLDEQGSPITEGQVGEICIGGAGVGRGYRNQPELTTQKFVPDLFAKSAGTRMYRTGDLGVLLPNGQIEFRGREDNQTKVRGQRVELDEIASVLARHPDVAFATVDAKETENGDHQLVAYILPEASAAPSVQDLQEFLARSLPGYMVPSVFVRLNNVPLSANGKIDRSQLEAPTIENSLSTAQARAPQSPIEETLLTMVRELLETDAVTVEDDFFLVGGHSLLGTQLVLRVRSAFGVDLNLRDLFESSTVESLAITIEDLLLAELDAMSDEEAARQVAG